MTSVGYGDSGMTYYYRTRLLTRVPTREESNTLVTFCFCLMQIIQAVYVFETAFRTRAAPETWDPSSGDVVDLHGYSAAVAKAAVRSGLKTLLRRFLTAGTSSVRGIFFSCLLVRLFFRGTALTHSKQHIELYHTVIFVFVP